VGSITTLRLNITCSGYFRQEVRVFARCSVRVSCCVSQIYVDMKCIKLTVRVFGGLNEVVAIE